MEAELSACVRLHPQGLCWSWAHGGKFCQQILLLLASRSGMLWFFFFSSTCSFLHLTFLFMPQFRPTSSAVHCYIFIRCSFLCLQYFFFIVNLPVVIKVSLFPPVLLEEPRVLWYRNISSGISCLFPVRGRRNLVLQVNERERERDRESDKERKRERDLRLPLSQLSCCRINFRLITTALSQLSNCR